MRNPFLVKICAATRTSFIETAAIEDFLDGLLARFVFTSGQAEEQPMRPMTVALEIAWRAVVDQARTFHTRAQDVERIELPAEVLTLEWELEQQLKATAMTQARSEAARPAMKRLAETVLKVAALLALERAPDGAPTLTVEDFAVAATLAEPWQRTTLELIRDIGRSRFQAWQDAVEASVRAMERPAAGADYRKLYRAHQHLRKRDFDEVIAALETQGRLAVEWTPNPRGGHKLGRVRTIKDEA